jgi:hypothetical protein
VVSIDIRFWPKCRTLCALTCVLSALYILALKNLSGKFCAHKFVCAQPCELHVKIVHIVPNVLCVNVHFMKFSRFRTNNVLTSPSPTPPLKINYSYTENNFLMPT